jgi:hypothetical protein
MADHDNHHPYLAKVEVVSSNLIARSIFLPNIREIGGALWRRDAARPKKGQRIRLDAPARERRR